ncbi:hypothetical protein [Actinoplanes sp. NPDC051411]|uniref:hypothetical protein n=1 Tax=Actinoplanes sp. NPDC051411 TaxID=3155522 RepID=UPI00342BE343
MAILVSPAATTFGGMVAGAWLGYDVAPRYDGGHDVQWLLLVGAIAGVTAGLTIGHRGRGWVQAWRLHRMRRRDTVTVTATVRQATPRVIHNPRGGSVTVYWVRVGWRDPLAGDQSGLRQYKFYGRRAPAFEAQVHPGAQVPVVHPATHPNRFVIDVPYAPTMADQFI